MANYKKKRQTNNQPFEQKLWASADKLRKNMDAAEYKHIVLGLIFLKYISDAFEEKYLQLKFDFENPKSQWHISDKREVYHALNDRDEYRADNVFYVPEQARWKYGTPPTGNANFAWVQHFIYHLAPTGSAGFVLSNGSLSSNTGSEGDIRKAIVENDLVDCIVMLPTQLFYNTGIPACLWFVSRYKNGNKARSRKGEVLFIDASEMGAMINRRNRILTENDIRKIADTYHEWKQHDGAYEDVKGFCKSATLDDIRKHNYVLTPGRYVGIPDEEDDLPAPRPGVFFVYAILCDNDSLYIGQSDNLQRRWKEHIAGKAAQWTKKHKPRYIAHYEEFKSREEAVAREKELKTTSGRRWLKKAIAEGRARQAGGVPFEEKMAALTAELQQQMAEGQRLDREIKEQLAKIGFDL